MVVTKSTLGAKATKMLDYINHIIRVELIDGRSFVGQFLAYDAHMNIVLVHAKEVITKGIRKDLPPLPNLPGEDITVEKTRGLVLIRGVNVISVHICGPPPSNTDDEIPKQFPTANLVKFQMDAQMGTGVMPPASMLAMMSGANMMAPKPGMMPPAGMPAPVPGMPAPVPGMMPPRPGMMPPAGMPMPMPGMMPPAGMPAPMSAGMPAGMPAPMPAPMPAGMPAGMPAPMPAPMPAGMPAGMPAPMPGMMPPMGMMPPRPGMMPPRPGMMPPMGMLPPQGSSSLGKQ